jgi:hypothetical protein
MIGRKLSHIPTDHSGPLKGKNNSVLFEIEPNIIRVYSPLDGCSRTNINIWVCPAYTNAHDLNVSDKSPAKPSSAAEAGFDGRCFAHPGGQVQRSGLPVRFRPRELPQTYLLRIGDRLDRSWWSLTGPISADDGFGRDWGRSWWSRGTVASSGAFMVGRQNTLKSSSRALAKLVRLPWLHEIGSHRMHLRPSQPT